MSAAAEAFCDSGLARFINSPLGRGVRIVVGAALIYWGYTQRSTPTGFVLMIVGLIPLVAGLFNLCLVSALLGGPISGAAIAQRQRSSGGG